MATPPWPRSGTLVAAALFLGLLVGCAGNIVPLYEEARRDALAPPPAVPATWAPDAVLMLSPDLLNELVGQALEAHGTLEQRLQVTVVGATATLDPRYTVQSLQLGPSRRCDECLAVTAHLEGEVAWRLARQQGAVPSTLQVGFDAAFEAVDRDGVFDLTMVLRDVRDLRLTVGQAGGALDRVLEHTIADWLRDHLIDEVPPVPVARLGEEQPLRALAVLPSGRGLQVSMLTHANQPVPVDVPRGPPSEGWQLVVSQGSLLALARTAAFETGPVSHDVVVEPTALRLGEGDFTLGLRLWRPVGRGWWRDYEVSGDLAVETRSVRLEATDVQARGASPGATLVDPLAALGQGIILRTIEENVAATVPASRADQVAGLRTDLRVTGVQGDRAAVRISGTLAIRPEGRGPRQRGERTRGR